MVRGEKRGRTEGNQSEKVEEPMSTEKVLGVLDMVESHITDVRAIIEESQLNRAELNMRRAQLTEIRVMLRLPETIQHEAVIRALYLIGETDRRISRELPERYQGRAWTQRRNIPSPFDPSVEGDDAEEQKKK